VGFTLPSERNPVTPCDAAMTLIRMMMLLLLLMMMMIINDDVDDDVVDDDDRAMEMGDPERHCALLYDCVATTLSTQIMYYCLNL
jgi:hypothetical protein